MNSKYIALIVASCFLSLLESAISARLRESPSSEVEPLIDRRAINLPLSVLEIVLLKYSILFTQHLLWLYGINLLNLFAFPKSTKVTLYFASRCIAVRYHRATRVIEGFSGRSSCRSTELCITECHFLDHYS